MKTDNLWISQFCKRTAVILKSGMTVYDGLRLLAESADDESRALYKEISDSLMNGCNISDAIKITNRFPDYMVGNIRAAEKTGNLEKTFDSLADYYNRLDDMNNSIANSVKYPVFMSVMMFAIIGVVALKVLPLFSKIYMRLGAQANSAAVMIMTVSNYLSYAVFAIGGLFSALCLYVFIAVKTQNGRQRLLKIAGRISFTRNIMENIDISFLLRNVGMFLSAGIGLSEIPAEHGLSFLSPRISEKAIKLNDCFSKGDTMYTAVKECDILTPMEREIIRLSEMTGELKNTVSTMTDSYMKRAYEEIGNAVSLIEPVLISVFAAVIGAILICTILPLLSITVGML
ncbi:MAG: type II secretion system F family protein [Oscillospiraceae bacterium]|nr:type II secretion system F family protein [Oscillospiraceae bacterium]